MWCLGEFNNGVTLAAKIEMLTTIEDSQQIQVFKNSFPIFNLCSYSPDISLLQEY